MSTLQEEDFKVTLEPLTVEASYFSSIDEIYKTWLLFNNLMNTKGIRVKASYFTLDAIEAGGQINMSVGRGQFISSVPTAAWAAWDYEGNPHYGSRALKLRAFVAAAVDMMMMDRNHANGHNRRSDFLGMQLIAWAYPYGVAKDILPKKVRLAYEKGLIRMFEKLEKWGPTGTHADMDMAAMVGMLYTAKFVDSQDLTQRAYDYIDLLLDRFLADAGYIEHGGAYDAGYNGISLFYTNWAAQISEYPPLIDALKKMSKFKAYVTLTDPDGLRISPFHTNPSSPADAPHDLWAPYSRDVGIASFSDNAIYLTKPVHTKSWMLNELVGKLTYFNSSSDQGRYQLLNRSSDEPKKWNDGHWLGEHSFNATAFYYEQGLYSKLKSKQNSSLSKPPFERSGSFTKSFADKWLSVKRQTYGAIIFNDRLSWWTGEGDTKNINGFGGGNISAFWTPSTGTVILGGTRTSHRKDLQGNEGLDLEDWRIWPIHALTGVTMSGKAFSSALQRYPEATYNLDHNSPQVIITGNLSSIYSDPTKSLSGEVKYKRVFEIHKNGLLVTTSVITGSSDKISKLYEIIPIYRRNAYRQPSAVPTKIEFKVNGNWQRAGTQFKKVTNVRLSRFDGQVYIDFKNPVRIKLSPKEFYQAPKKKTLFQSRNIMIDLLENGGQPAKLTDTSVTYFIRSSKAPPHNWNSDGAGGNGGNSGNGGDEPKDTTAPDTKISVSPKAPTNSQKVTFTATAGDKSGIEKLAIYVDGDMKKVCKNSSKCKVTLGPLSTGSHTYQSKAIDGSSQSNTSYSKEKTFKVSKNKPEDTTAPETKITHSPGSPYDNQKVTFTATASDKSGIQKLLIYVNGSKEKTCRKTTTCKVTLPPLSAGSHTYQSKAVDGSSQSNASRSKEKTFKVNQTPTPNTPPSDVSVALKKESNYLKAKVKNVSDPDGDEVFLVYDWRVNGKSLAVVNLPFDINSINVSKTDADKSKSFKNYTTYKNPIHIGNGKASPGWIRKGKRGGALVFDGKNDYMRVSTGSSIDHLQKFTIEVWIKHDNWGDAWASIISKPYYTEAWKNPWAVFKLSRKSNTDHLHFQIAVGKDKAVSLVSKQEIPANKWVHVAATYDGKNLKLYINGRLDNTLHVNKPLATKKNTDIFIGKNSKGTSDSEQYRGALDEVHIYNIALSEKQIKQHYQGNYDKMLLGQIESKSKWKVAVTANDMKTYAGKPSVSNMVTVSDKSDKIKANKSWLAQNYPNPFYNKTTIKYKLSKPQTISLKIYDTTGRLVKTVYKGHKEAGIYKVPFDGTHLASGIYLIVLKLNEKAITRKMTLIH